MAKRGSVGAASAAVVLGLSGAGAGCVDGSGEADEGGGGGWHRIVECRGGSPEAGGGEDTGGEDRVDADGDGYTALEGDCDDGDAGAHPGAACLWTLETSAVAFASGTGERAGSAVVAAGDVDGDGLADLLVGSPWTDVGGEREGKVGLVTGLRLRLRPAYDLALLPAPAYGLEARAEMGVAVLALPDLDGDGVAEVAMSGPGAETVWVISGARLLGARSFTVADAMRTLVGPLPGDAAGHALATVDDLDGDGLRELAVGAPGEVGAGGVIGGAVFVVRSSALVAASAEAVSLDEIAAARIDGGRTGEETGTALAGDGDLDGDGIDDLAVGAPGAGLGGEVRVYSGARLFQGGDIGPGDAAVTLEAAAPGEEMGTAVAWARLPDGGTGLWAGAPGASARAQALGKVGVARLWGPESLPAGGRAGAGAARTTLAGTAVGQEAGATLAVVGDLDGDGLDEVAVGAPGDRRGAAGGGSAWIFTGADVARGGERGLEEARIGLVGTEGGQAGRALAAGDVDGDGVPDLAVGAPAHDGGAVWVWSGASLLPPAASP
ncbi:hypothetical protein L6R50_11125 [Myxococcota bacterium]|nr:hypothetical protein [Myxococcota bacterium]